MSGVSQASEFGCDATGVLDSPADTESVAAGSSFVEVEAGSGSCARRLRGRTFSPRTRWQYAAMAVLLVGKQCCVSNSAMERYDPPFCRSSTMTSFAGIKSWNFWGRRGVNSATALRTSAGLNVLIGRNGRDEDLEIGRRPCGHDDAATRTILCQSNFGDNLGSWPVPERGLFEAGDCLRTIHVHCCCAVMAC